MLALSQVLDRPDIGRAALLSGVLGEIGSRRILTVGIVKRGKSTLVNQLLDLQLSPVRVLPETTGLIAYACDTRPAAAWGVTPEGYRHRLPAAPWRFRRKVSRKARVTRELAVRHGHYEIPMGVTLVDSVGQSEAALSEHVRFEEIPADVMAEASGVIVVFGVPGVSATDLELLQTVLRIRAHQSRSVLVVIKSLDATVQLEDLRQYRSELAQHPSLREVIERAVLVREGDSDGIAMIREWIALVTSTDADGVRPKTWMTELESAVASRLDNGDAIDLDDFTVSHLPDFVREFVEYLSPSAIAERDEQQLLANHEALRVQFEAEFGEWRQALDILEANVSSLHRKIEETTKSAKAARSGGWGPGCGILLVFPISFVAFPFGPLIVGGIFFFWLSALSEQKDAAARPFEERAISLQAELDSALEQARLQRARRPDEPTMDPALRSILRRVAWQRRRRTMKVAFTVAAVLGSGLVAVLLIRSG